MLPEMLAGLGQTQPSVGPQLEPFTGTHYAKDAIKGGVLHGDKRGMSGEGEESNRVYLPPRGAPAAVHVYADDGQVFGKHPQILSRPNAYQVKGDYALATIEDTPEWGAAKQDAIQKATHSGVDPKQAELVGRNEAEWALKEAGYNGYRSRNVPGNVVLFGDHPAKSLDKVQAEKEKAEGVGTDQAPAQPQASVANVDTKPTFTAPFTYPMSSPDEHEQHQSESDPANLQFPYQKTFGVVPHSSAEHDLLSHV